jgi:hypothetical protein
MEVDASNHGRRHFAKKGYTVALIARGADSARKLADDITSAGGKVTTSLLRASLQSHIHHATRQHRFQCQHTLLRTSQRPGLTSVLAFRNRSTTSMPRCGTLGKQSGSLSWILRLRRFSGELILTSEVPLLSLGRPFCRSRRMKSMKRAENVDPSSSLGPHQA